MDWFKKHVDTCIIMGGVVSSFLWMNSSINDLKNDISDLKTQMAIVKTVLLMKNILPSELAKEGEK
jgi:hypothetical protein